MDFFLFLLVNATLFIRPGELIPATQGWPIYNAVIVLNLLVAAPAIINHLTQNGLTRCPTTTCVLGVLAFIVISHLARFDLYSARTGAFDFAKVVAYYLLLISTVNTPKRLFTLLGTVGTLTLTINLIAVLHYHGKIDLPALSVLIDSDWDETTGERYAVPRMRATGIFNDPNDLSMIIVASILIFAGGMFYSKWVFARFLLAAPIGFLGYALTLTQSRGGLLALLAGCGAYFYARFGFAKAAMLGSAGIPVLLAGFGGRQVDFGRAIAGGTGHSRAELWSAGLQLFKASPIFGVGHNQYSEHAGLVAHNSYIHAFVELGFFGGLMFLGLIVIAGWSLWKLLPIRGLIGDPGLRHFLPFAAAVLAAFSISMMSLSRSYVAPTYLIAGSAAVCERLVRQDVGLPAVVLNGRVIIALGFASVGFVGVIYLYINVLHRMG